MREEIRKNPTSSPGFSLLELIAAMTILIIVIGILGRIVTDTQRVWRQGTDAAELSLNARAAFALLDGDLGSAVCSSNLLFELEPQADVMLHGTNLATSLLFYRLGPLPKATELRSFQQVHVFSTPPDSRGLRALFRERRAIAFDEPDPEDWEAWATTNAASQIVLDNITALAITAIHPHDPSDPTDSAAPFARSVDYDSADYTNALPLALDLELELLPDRAARRYALLPAEQRDAFVQQHAVRFAHRIHFRNRQGGLLP